MCAAGHKFLSMLLSAVMFEILNAETLRVTCPSSQEAATLTLSNLTASYQCSNMIESTVQIVGPHVQINVEVDTLTIVLQPSSIERLSISSCTTKKPIIRPTALDFSKFSQLRSLTFVSVAMDSIELAIQNVITDIHIVNSMITDLSLPLRTKALSEIELTGTSVTKLLMFLYERNLCLDSRINITVDLSSVTGEIELSAEQLTFLEANAETLVTQPWVHEFRSRCHLKSSRLTVPTGNNNKIVSCGSATLPARRMSTNDIHAVAKKNGYSNDGSKHQAEEPDDVTSSISIGVLAPVIVAAAVVAVALVLVVLRMYSKRKGANANAQNNEAMVTLMSKGDSIDKNSFISNDEFLRSFHLPQSDMALVKSVGTDRLWTGEYNGRKVAVKRMESEVTDPYRTKALMAQARAFATISHPNITNLVGVTWLAGTDFAVVTEYMEQGNLRSVLTNTDVSLNVKTKLRMCSDVAKALACLHEAEQILCAKQVSSQQVLVNKDTLDCKLSLFECVPNSAKSGGSSVTCYGMGEIAWLSPEVITRSSPIDGRKSNIYALGVLISEIFTRVPPYQSLVEEMGNTMSDLELVRRIWRQDPLEPHENRLEYVTAPAIVRQLVDQCLSYAPMSRPTAKKIVAVLHRAKEELGQTAIEKTRVPDMADGELNDS